MHCKKRLVSETATIFVIVSSSKFRDLIPSPTNKKEGMKKRLPVDVWDIWSCGDNEKKGGDLVLCRKL